MARNVKVFSPFLLPNLDVTKSGNKYRNERINIELETAISTVSDNVRVGQYELDGNDVHKANVSIALQCFEQSFRTCQHWIF